jgi:AraC-like DNA-binding protein
MHELSTEIVHAVTRPFRHFVSDDLDRTRDQIASVFCPHRLVPEHKTRTYQARMDFIRVAGLGFGTLHLGGAMSVHVPEMSDYYLLLLCLQGSSAVSSEGAEVIVSGKRGFICNPGQGFTANFSADAEQLFLRVERGIFWQHTGMRHLRMRSDIDLGQPTLVPADASIRMLLSSGVTIAMMQENPRIANDYQQLLIGLLLAGQHHVNEVQSRRSGIAPATVRRAEEFIRGHAACAITLDDISSASGVPIRTLLEGFRRFRGVSPMRMLRDVRLDQARQRLKSSSDGNVAGIALSCGFGHLGRFAQVYTERFGELPSETRARRPTGQSAK